MKQKNIEFLLCFDKNYLNQGFSAILSLLSNVDKEIDIHIIHNVEKIESLIPDAIDSNINLKSINFYQVRKTITSFQILKISMSQKRLISGFLHLNC